MYSVFPDPKNPKVLLNGVETDEHADIPGSIYRWQDKELKTKLDGESIATFIWN